MNCCLLESMFIYCICTQYLVGAPFALIYCHQFGMEVISLWHCWGGMEAQVSLTVAFSSSALLGLVSLIFSSWQYPIDSLWGSGSGEFAGQSSTVTPWSLTSFGTIVSGAGAKSCWKMKSSISISLQQKEAWSALKFLVDGCIDCGLQKTQWTSTSRWQEAQIITDCGNFTLDFKQHGIWASPLFPPDSGTLFLNEMQNLLSSKKKRTLDPLSSYLHSPGKTLLTLSLVQKCLVALFWRRLSVVDSWCTDSSFSPLLVKLLQVFESALLDSILKLAVIPVACAHFPTQILPSSQLCI